MVVVCIGLDAWKRAKAWSASPNDVEGLVCPDDSNPADYLWQVSKCLVIVERSHGPCDDYVLALVKELLVSGSNRVIVRDMYRQSVFKFWAEE